MRCCVVDVVLCGGWVIAWWMGCCMVAGVLCGG